MSRPLAKVASSPSQRRVRKRRPSSELARPYRCNQNDCGRRYEEFRTLQQHLQTKHGVRVSLRHKKSNLSAYEHLGNAASSKQHPVHYQEKEGLEVSLPSNVMGIMRSDSNKEAQVLPVIEEEDMWESRSQATAATMAASCVPASVAYSPVSSVMDPILEDILGDDLSVWDTSFLQSVALPFTEDEIVNMYMDCLKKEAADKDPSSTLQFDNIMRVPDRNLACL